MVLFQSMMQFKEKKDLDDSFKKAQKPWAKLLYKVSQADEAQGEMSRP